MSNTWYSKRKLYNCDQNIFNIKIKLILVYHSCPIGLENSPTVSAACIHTRQMFAFAWGKAVMVTNHFQWSLFDTKGGRKLNLVLVAIGVRLYSRIDLTRTKRRRSMERISCKCCDPNVLHAYDCFLIKSGTFFEFWRLENIEAGLQ